MSPRDDEGLWVRSEVMPTGAYGVAINVGADRAWPLGPDQAIRYAASCVRRATEAEHDTAVIALLVASGVEDKHAAELVAYDVRPDRVVDHGPTEPLRFLVGVAHDGPGEFRPFLRMQLDGEDVGQLDPDALRGHAVGVLNTLAAADLDAAVHRTLVHTVGVDDARARAMVGTLSEYWPQGETARRAGGAR